MTFGQHFFCNRKSNSSCRAGNEYYLLSVLILGGLQELFSFQYRAMSFKGAIHTSG